MKTTPRPTVLGSVLRFWVVTLLLVVIGATLGWVAAGLVRPQPQAVTVLVVRDPRSTASSDGTAAARYAAAQATLIASNLVLEPTHAQLLQASPPSNISTAALKHGLTISPPTDSNALKITFTDADGHRAAVVANMIVQQYRAVVGKQFQQDATAQLKKIDASLAVLQKQIPATGNSPAAELARAERAGLLGLRSNVLADLTAGDGVTAVSPAVAASSSSVKAALVRGAVLGAIVGVLVGALVASLLASRRRRWENWDQPEMVLDGPCLGELRLRKQTATVPRDFTAVAGNLVGRQERLDAWSLGVVADSVGSASTDVILALASATARLGRRVLVILPPEAGVSEVGQRLLKTANVGSSLREVQSPETNLPTRSVSVAGSEIHVAVCEARPTEAYLRAARLGADHRGPYDLVLVDVSPTRDGRETLLATVVDANLAIVRHKSSTRALEGLAERMSLVGASILGYVYLRAARPGGRSVPVRELFDAVTSRAVDRHRTVVDVQNAS